MRGDGLLKILGETAIAVEPREGAFDHLPARQDLEALGFVRRLDDVDDPFAGATERARELLSA